MPQAAVSRMLANSRALQPAWDSARDAGARRPRELEEESEVSATPKIRRSGVHRPASHQESRFGADNSETGAMMGRNQ